jgi:hypothetical protein
MPTTAQDFVVIIHKTDGTERHGRADGEQHVGVTQVRPQERRNHDGGDNQHAAHGRRSGFLLVGLGTFVANILLHLQ